MVNKAEVVQKIKELRSELIEVMNNKKEVVMILALSNYNSNIETVTKWNMQLVYELLSIELDGILRCGCAHANEYELADGTLGELQDSYFNNDVEGVQNIVYKMHSIRAKCMDYDNIINHIEHYSNEEDKISDEIYELEKSLGIL
jgi:hypothetical protein